MSNTGYGSGSGNDFGAGGASGGTTSGGGGGGSIGSGGGSTGVGGGSAGSGGSGGYGAGGGTGSGGTGSGGYGAGGGTGSGIGSASTTGAGTGTQTGGDLCPHCGQAMGGGGLEAFLGRLGITGDMMDNLKGQFQNVDIDEYLNTARDYLKNGSNKASTYAKDNPGKVAAGVAALALGAGLLYAAVNRDKS